jgi:hypothetical protein
LGLFLIGPITKKRLNLGVVKCGSNQNLAVFFQNQIGIFFIGKIIFSFFESYFCRDRSSVKKKFNQLIMKLLRWTYLLLWIFNWGCSAKSGSETDLLFQEIMDAHDEVMPKMGKIRNLEKQFRSAALTSPDSTELSRQAETLASANEAMMTWMRNFNNDFQGSDGKKKEYLLRQKMQVYQVKELMNSSILISEDLMGSAID